MKKSITTKNEINAPIENVWANISKTDGVDLWMPVITSCRLEGTGVGSKRVCTTEQGAIDETILTIDNENKIFQYAINEQPLLPIANIIGTMKLNDLGKATELEWTLEFTIADESLLSMVKEGLYQLYASGAKGLETISQ